MVDFKGHHSTTVQAAIIAVLLISATQLIHHWCTCLQHIYACINGGIRLPIQPRSWHEFCIVVRHLRIRLHVKSVVWVAYVLRPVLGCRIWAGCVCSMSAFRHSCRVLCRHGCSTRVYVLLNSLWAGMAATGRLVLARVRTLVPSSFGNSNALRVTL